MCLLLKNTKEIFHNSLGQTPRLLLLGENIMRATITGASGLVGANLAIELIKLGHQVVCTKRRASNVKHLSSFPIEWVEADLSNQKALSQAMKGSNVVFHCAAQISFKKNPTQEMLDTNLSGTTNIINAVKEAKVPRFVHCSSVVARAISLTGEPVTEDQAWNFDKFGLDDSYSVTKYKSEQLVLEAVKNGLDAVIVNPTYMFGPYDSKPSSGKLIIDVIKGKIPTLSTGYNNFVDVRDVCRGMILAWQKGKTGQAYILGNQNLTYGDAIRLIARVAGVQAPKLELPKAIATIFGLIGDIQEKITKRDALINSITVKYAYCKNYKFSSGKAIKELGYSPSPLERAISDAINWFRAEKMID